MDVDPYKTFSINPEPTFVKKIEPDLCSTLPENEVAGVGYLLLCHEEVLVSQKTEHYYHFAIHLSDENCVQNYSNLQFDFEPSYEELIIHKVGIWRNGNFIAKCESNRFQLIRREANLERFILDGRYSATTLIEDVRVGDTIEYSYTVKGDNPVFDGKISGIFSFNFSLPTRHVFYQLHHPNDRKFYRKTYASEHAAKEVSSGVKKTLTWEFHDVPSEFREEGAPGWAISPPRVEYTEFESWEDVAKWASRKYLFSDAGASEFFNIVTELTSNLDALDSKIERLVEFVQSEIRYTGIAIGPYTHQPRPPSEILAKRYGDCKEKSLLLCSLLKQIGVAADVMLVNDLRTRALKDCLPSPFVFSHAIVHLGRPGMQIIDPTIAGQVGKISERWLPDYAYGLIVNVNQSSLTEIKHKTTKAGVNRNDLIIVKDFKKPVEFLTKGTYFGVEADYQRWGLKNAKLSELKKSNEQYYASLFGNVQVVEEITYVDSEDSNTINSESGFYLLNVLELTDSKSHYVLDMEAYTITNRMPYTYNVNRKLPLALTYPLEITHEITLHLPEKVSIKKDRQEIRGESFTFSREVIPKGRQVDLKFHFVTLKDIIDSSSYTSERTLLHRVYALLRYRVVRDKTRKVPWYWWILIIVAISAVRALFRKNGLSF